MLPSRYFSTGHLVIEHESVICVGGADVRHGTLDGLAVVVRSIPSILTGSSGGSQQVIFTTLDVHMQSGLSHMLTPFPERLQRNYYLEELRPPECITSSRRRHVHFATLYHLSTYGPRKFERVSRAFPKRPKVEIGEGISGIQPNPSYGASSCSTSPEAWNTCMTRTVSMVT